MMASPARPTGTRPKAASRRCPRHLWSPTLASIARVEDPEVEDQAGSAVMPPWVRMQFREASQIVKSLRDTNCGDPNCIYCRANNDPKQALKRWFGFDDFRPEPIDEFGVEAKENECGCDGDPPEPIPDVQVVTANENDDRQGRDEADDARDR